MDKAKEPFVPATEPPSMLWVAAILLSWICLSTAVIFGNREIMLGPSLFSYPITLTSAHLLFQVIATRVLHRFTTAISGAPSPEDEYALLPTGAALPEQGDETVQSLTPEARWKQTSVEMTWAYWRRNIVPPAVLFSASLVLSNWAYLLLGVAYIQQVRNCSLILTELTMSSSSRPSRQPSSSSLPLPTAPASSRCPFWESCSRFREEWGCLRSVRPTSTAWAWRSNSPPSLWRRRGSRSSRSFSKERRG